jgi:hypothetical protein
VIGGSHSFRRNVISGNGATGVRIRGEGSLGNEITGNYIGTSADGTVGLGNGENGVYLLQHPQDTVIGPDNVISGNEGYGVLVSSSVTGTVVMSNTIGAAANGVDALPNSGMGVAISSGGTVVGPGNTIAHNNNDGIAVWNGMGTVITQNSIHTNFYEGIDLNVGINGGIAPPVVDSVLGQAHGTACPGCTVEVFSNSTSDDEGETYLGRVVADGSGDFTVAVGALDGVWVTATATDPISGTSEFSGSFYVTGDYVLLPLLTRDL